MKHPIITQLRMERRTREISQDSMAAMTGYHRVQIVQYENGYNSPKLETVSNWAEALGYELVLKKRGE